MSAADALLTAPSREPARHSNVTRVVIYGLLIVFAIIYLLPLIVMVMTSLKPLEEVTGGNMFYVPQHLTFEPWTKAWGTACVGLTCAGLKGYVWNSVKMVIPAVLISSLLGALNGYVLTKWRFPGHKLVFGMMLFACFIPFQSVLIPMATILGKLGAIGQSLEGAIGWSLGFGNPTVNLVLVHVVYGLGFTTLFFRNYYETFPERADQGRTDRRREFLPDFSAHPAAEFYADLYRHRHLPVHQHLERLPVRLDLRRWRFGPDDGRALQHRQHLNRRR